MKGLNRKRFQRGQVDVTSILFFSHVNFEGLKLSFYLLCCVYQNHVVSCN